VGLSKEVISADHKSDTGHHTPKTPSLKHLGGTSHGLIAPTP